MKGLRLFLLLVSVAGLCVVSSFGQGGGSADDTVVVPPSSVENPADIGRRAHTNHLILVRPQRGNPFGSATPVGETPGSLSCVYQTSPASSSTCPITGKISSGNNGLPNPSSGSGVGVIAIVDAYDYPTAENDLNVFSSQFSLPACTTTNGCFQKVYATGTQPSANCSWAQEEALDIEWAHAMSPSAKIVLVEAASNSFSDLFAAVDVASSFIASNGEVGEVSMSWGGSEFSTESAFDSHFTNTLNANNRVVYFAASGDSGGSTIYPGVSPNVVCAGGTTINRNSSGNFLGESAWSGSGGGPSIYEPLPVAGYQNALATLLGNHRGAPDFSFDANPNTGVWVYDSTPCKRMSGWMIFGGTSVASPSLSGIVNLAASSGGGGAFAPTTPAELGTIYSICGSGGASSCSSPNFRDITSGSAGSYNAAIGWDFVTGVGSNLTLSGK